MSKACVLGRRARVALALSLAVFAHGRAANADDARAASGTTAAAQALFDDAKALMTRSKWAEACPKLEESQRLQPAGGTLMFLAMCQEGSGHTATAWTTFNEVMSVARRDARADRERVAREHIAALAPKLMRLTLVRADSATPGPALVIKLDGLIVSMALLGTAVAVDPGPHLVTASAPGMKPWEAKAELTRPGATTTIAIPALDREDAPAAASPPRATPSDDVSAPNANVGASLRPSDSARPGSTQRTLAVVVGTVGVVGVGVGTVFGLQALAKKTESDRGCPGGSAGACSADGVSASKTAVTDGNVSTIAFAVGGAALVGAFVLWITAPNSTTAARLRVVPSVGASRAGLQLVGGF